MEKDLISIITVTKNNKFGLQRTLSSIISQTCKDYEIIVIDGLSDDGTLDIIVEYERFLSYYVSEKDDGIYDAMNKGLGHAKGEFVLFLNSGDLFYNDSVIEKFNNLPDKQKYACFFSNTVFDGKESKLLLASKTPCRIIHQSFIYRKSLHEKYGMYLSYKGITISDYLFFNLVHNENWLKLPFIVSKCDSTGVSQKNNHYYQKLGVDLIFGNFSRKSIGLMLFIFPLYKILKNIQTKMLFKKTVKDKI